MLNQEQEVRARGVIFQLSQILKHGELASARVQLTESTTKPKLKSARFRMGNDWVYCPWGQGLALIEAQQIILGKHVSLPSGKERRYPSGDIYLVKDVWVAQSVQVEKPKKTSQEIEEQKTARVHLKKPRNKDTKNILRLYDSHLRRGKADRKARELIIKKMAKSVWPKREVKGIIRSVDYAINLYRQNCNATLE